jgi:hypothetical protein
VGVILTRTIVRLVAVLICLCAVFCAIVAGQAAPLTITEQAVPALNVGMEFHMFLRASGGSPPYVWSVASGELPDGITLTPEGLLSGRPTKPGKFDLVLKVEDSGRPPHSVTKDLHGTVSVSLLLEWLDSPKVHDGRIDGSVQVSNGSQDIFDLTVIIVAVADNGRATALGYEHFSLKPGATNVPITFGTTLPPGPYVIHADAIAEIPARKNILRQRLQTPQPLQIVAGP